MQWNVIPRPPAWHLGFFGPRLLSPSHVNRPDFSADRGIFSAFAGRLDQSILTESTSWTRGLKVGVSQRTAKAEMQLLLEQFAKPKRFVRLNARNSPAPVAQNISLQRGLLPAIDQKIEMAPASITIDAGAGSVTIQSLTEITLSVAGGMSSITLTPTGITNQGILVQIN